jgi:YfiH family protein
LIQTAGNTIVQKVEFQGLVGFRFEQLADPHTMRHVFGARNPSDAGNLALSGGRDRKAALLARATWSQYLQVPAEQWVVGGQTHSAHVQVVGEAQRSRGAQSPQDVLPDTDGLFTTCSGLPLYVAVADCSAVLLFAPGALAVVHGGWRGLAKGILPAAVQRFLQHGYAATEIRAGIMPCIAAASYEVGPEVAASCPPSAKYTGREDRWHVDIGQWAAAELMQAGLETKQIKLSGMDTGQDPQLFSHRRQGVGAGRNGLIAVLA